MSGIALPGIVAASRRRAGGGGTGYSAAVLADSPLLYLRLEETAGATCANSGSLGGSATAVGTYTRNIATGLVGLGVGIDLDGISGAVSYPDNPSLDILGDVTYECWVKPDTLASVFMLSKGLNTGGASGGYDMQLRSTGDIRLFVNSGLVLTTSSGGITTAAWSHCVFTRSGNNYICYVNAVSKGTATVATAATASTEPFTAGCRSTGGVLATFLDGKIDEVAVYNTALSPTQITAHYAARNT